MQERQRDRARYFRELASTSERYFIPYLSDFMRIESGMNVLEIGCGEGGNLLPFAERGCRVTGVDLASGKIDNARKFFAAEGQDGTFIASDIFKVKELEASFDLIICHDVLEHIGDKFRFMCDLGKYLRQGGIVFMAFPAWQMPFGGHQQICRSRFLSRLPFFHLLPKPLYRAVLKAGGEEEYRIRELLEIKDTRLSVEQFERMLQQKGKRTDASMDAIRPLEILDRRLWLINPHYEAKFGLKPRLLARPVAAVPYLRDFFTTSCFYILKCLSAEES